MVKTKDEINFNPKPRFYAVLLPKFVKAAAEMGYALAVHGSMGRDLDLVAVAWVKEAKPVDELVQELNKCIGETVWSPANLLSFELKPHNRLTYTLSIIGDWFIDLSIMPPLKEEDIYCQYIGTEINIDEADGKISDKIIFKTK